MIGQVRPGFVTEYSRFVTAGIAHIDAIQAQHRPARRECLGDLALGNSEDLVQPGAAIERARGLQSPVIEVTSDHHWRTLGQRVEQVAEQFNQSIRAYKAANPS